MSTSVIHPGTSGATGPSGRLVGLVIAGLAAAIAIGVVVASNQGNEATETAPVVRTVDQDALWESKIDFLRNQYLTQSSTNIELFKVKLAQKAAQAEANAINATNSPEAVNGLNRLPQVHVPSIVSAVPAPVFSPELARMQSINASRLQAMWSQRYQDLIDRFENQMVPKGQAVYVTENVPVAYRNLMAFFETRIAEAKAQNVPQAYEDLMNLFETRIEEAKASNVELPREKRGIGH